MHKKKITPTGALLYVFLTVVLVFMMIPFVWLLISSLRPNADLFNEPFAVPKTLSFENFRAVMESHPMLLYFANSVAIATIATVIAVGAATLAAYAMQQRFLTRKSLTVLFSMCLFIPTNNVRFARNSNICSRIVYIGVVVCWIQTDLIGISNSPFLVFIIFD